MVFLFFIKTSTFYDIFNYSLNSVRIGIILADNVLNTYLIIVKDYYLIVASRKFIMRGWKS